jgi:tetratricopeptide (TPR) repeat protein
MDEHLTRDLFRAIHKGWRNPGDLAAIAMAHLFEECPRCRHEFEAWRRELSESVAAPEGQDFDAVFDRLRAPAAANDGDGTALEARVEAERQRAGSRAEQLLALPADQRLDWIRNERSNHSGLLLAEVLIEDCRRQTPGHPYEGKALALLARVVLQHALASTYAVELYALSLAWLANAIRVIGDLPRADQILADARYLLRAQSLGADRLVRAEVDSLEASLRTGQDRPSEAIPLVLRALMAYRLEKKKWGAEATCFLKLARAHARQGETERAIALNREVGGHAGAGAETRLHVIGRQNVASVLADAGKSEEASEALEEARPLYSRLDEPLEQLRCVWTEAKVLRGNGEHDAAADLLLSVRSGFAAKDLRYDQALASMELAGWYTAQGRRRDAEPLVEEALPIFQALDLPAKTAAARALRASLASSS